MRRSAELLVNGPFASEVLVPTLGEVRVPTGVLKFATLKRF